MNFPQFEPAALYLEGDAGTRRGKAEGAARKSSEAQLRLAALGDSKELEEVSGSSEFWKIVSTRRQSPGDG